MKIAILGHKRIPSNEGGIEKVVEKHAVRMAALGHKVIVYNRGGDNIYGSEYNNKRLKTYKGVKIITVPTTNGTLSVPICSFLATVHAALVRYDVVCFNASGSCAMIPLAKLFGLKCVATLHGFDSMRDKWGGFARRYLEFGERMASKHADVCLVLSRHMKDHIREKYGTEALISANGVERAELKGPDIIRRELGLETDSYILSLGRIVPEKGLHHLIAAFRKTKTDKKLIIAGGAEHNSDYYGQLQKMAKGDDRIIFIGFVQGQIINELYSNCYLFALPSHLEGMANTLLEAMSFGCCCLVSDIPENTEVVGLMAPQFRSKDEKDLRRKLWYLIKNPDVVMKYRQGAADYITERYNWDRVVDSLLEVYSGKRVEYSRFQSSGIST